MVERTIEFGVEIPMGETTWIAQVLREREATVKSITSTRVVFDVATKREADVLESKIHRYIAPAVSAVRAGMPGAI